MNDFANRGRNRAPDTGKDRAGNAELTVQELAYAIKRTVEGEFGYVRLRGEISGYRGPHGSGHHYFAVKDDKAKIDAVIWKGSYSKMKFKPEEGLEVIATGKVTTFPNGSKYQIMIESLEPAGAGALMALLEERKRKLQAEGLFAEERKRPLPVMPRVVGVITSPTGAVIRDILYVFQRRFPVHVVVWPVRVQGETASAEVTRAIEGFNALPQRSEDGQPASAMRRPDVLIVARGGGSLEDLWGFNEENVARAVAGSDIPVISAVGHETDTTLIDMVSDMRVSTPTKAAEEAVPLYTDLVQRMGELQNRLTGSVRRVLNEERSRWTSAARGLPRIQDLVALPRQRFDTAAGRLGRSLMANTQMHRTRLERRAGRLGPGVLAFRVERGRERLNTAKARGEQAMANGLALRRRQLDGHAKLLGSLGYHNVLARGYALIRDESGRAIRSASSLATGARFEIELADGRVSGQRIDGDAGAGDARPLPPPPADAEPKAAPKSGASKSSAKSRSKPASKPDNQGSLF